MNSMFDETVTTICMFLLDQDFGFSSTLLALECLVTGEEIFFII